MGVPQGAVSSPFSFSFHTDSLSYCHTSLLKYADDHVLCISNSKCSDQEGMDDDLSRLATWKADHGLIINKSKCAECLFYSSQLTFSFLNGEALSREQTVSKNIVSKNIGVHFFITWFTHTDYVFTDYLSFFAFAGCTL